MGAQLRPHSYLLVDSQSVKTNYDAEEVGFHGGKKVKGRIRQVAVDTQGNLWVVHLHAANRTDTVEGCVLADSVLAGLPGTKAICADSGWGPSSTTSGSNGRYRFMSPKGRARGSR